MIRGSCHCGAVAFVVPAAPAWLSQCNCSLCRRVGALWAYYDPEAVRIEAADGATLAYVQGDRTLALHTCRTCGCTAYWEPLGVDKDRMAVNFRLCEPDELAGIAVRHFDGADSWKYLD